jgi:hypothetical protein
MASERPSLAIIAGIIVAVLAPRTALAEPSAADRETARTEMRKGDERFAAKDFAAALQHYQAAHAIMQVPTTGLAVARAQIERKQLVEARDTLLQVARLPREAREPAPIVQARDEAAALAKDLVARIPSVVISIEGPSEGVDVLVDGELIPPAAVGAARKVNPGSHVITATLGGQVIASSTVAPKEGTTEKVTLKLTPGRVPLLPKAVEGGGTIHITSPDEPGNVFLDGKAVGATPLDVPAAAGKHEVEVEYAGGTHDSETITVTKNGTAQVVFHPSGMDAGARARRGLHLGFALGPATAVYLTGGFALYGGTASFVLHFGITPRVDFRTGAAATFLYRGNAFDPTHPAPQLSVVVPAMLKVNYTTWLSSAAGLSGGFVTDFETHSYSFGPEWSPLALSAGEKRQYELAFTQGFRFGKLDTDFHQAVVLTVLLL